MLEGRAKIDPRGSFLTSGSHFGKTKEIIMKEDKGGRRTLYVRCRCGFFWGHWRSLFTRTLSLCTLSFSFPSLPPMRACVCACVCVCVRAARSRARSAVWQGPRRRCRGGSRACATDLPTSQRFVAQRLCVEFRRGQNKKNLYIQTPDQPLQRPHIIY